MKSIQPNNDCLSCQKCGIAAVKGCHSAGRPPKFAITIFPSRKTGDPLWFCLAQIRAVGHTGFALAVVEAVLDAVLLMAIGAWLFSPARSASFHDPLVWVVAASGVLRLVAYLTKQQFIRQYDNGLEQWYQQAKKAFFSAQFEMDKDAVNAE